MTTMVIDQAQGLRRIFPASRLRFVAVAANPDVAFAGLALERLASACTASGRSVLVVDAARALAADMAAIDLAACIEPVGDRLHYLAAGGLPMRHVDARGSCESFLDALAAAAAPEVGVVIVHAEASELGRLFARRAARPVLVAADHPTSVTSAYANMKLLAQRFGLMAFDLLLVAAAASPRTQRIAEQMAITADRFCGAALHDWASIDPAASQEQPAALQRLARDLCDAEPRPLPAPRASMQALR
jgi:flagellar biosynthesis protein FlhG